MAKTKKEIIQINIDGAEEKLIGLDLVLGHMEGIKATLEEGGDAYKNYQVQIDQQTKVKETTEDWLKYLKSL